MTGRVKVLIADDMDYEDLIAEIQIDGDCVAVLSQEEGELKIQVDHSWVWSEGRKELPLSEFKRALENAESMVPQYSEFGLLRWVSPFSEKIAGFVRTISTHAKISLSWENKAC